MALNVIHFQAETEKKIGKKRTQHSELSNYSLVVAGHSAGPPGRDNTGEPVRRTGQSCLRAVQGETRAPPRSPEAFPGLLGPGTMATFLRTEGALEDLSSLSRFLVPCGVTAVGLRPAAVSRRPSAPVLPCSLKASHSCHCLNLVEEFSFSKHSEF